VFVAIKTISWVAMEAKAKARVDKALAERRCVACLEPFADNEVPDRGCHHRCAKATRRAIRRGIYTERKRIEEGKFLPPAQVGRPPSNPVRLEADRISASMNGAIE
jgi:hypothetical protein